MAAVALGVLSAVLALHLLGAALRCRELQEENDRLWRERRAAEHQARWVRWLLSQRDGREPDVLAEEFGERESESGG